MNELKVDGDIAYVHCELTFTVLSVCDVREMSLAVWSPGSDVIYDINDNNNNVGGPNSLYPARRYRTMTVSALQSGLTADCRMYRVAAKRSHCRFIVKLQ